MKLGLYEATVFSLKFQMHRLPSQSSLIDYRLSSLILVLRWLCLLVVLGLMGWGLVTYDRELFRFGAIAFGAWFILLVLGFIISAKLKCPLCMMPPFLNRGCSKHSTAGKIFGSHPLKVAQTILLKGYFRCPYCGEPTEMAVRPRYR